MAHPKEAYSPPASRTPPDSQRPAEQSLEAPRRQSERPRWQKAGTESTEATQPHTDRRASAQPPVTGTSAPKLQGWCSQTDQTRKTVMQTCKRHWMKRGGGSTEVSRQGGDWQSNQPFAGCSNRPRKRRSSMARAAGIQERFSVWMVAFPFSASANAFTPSGPGLLTTRQGEGTKREGLLACSGTEQWPG